MSSELEPLFRAYRAENRARGLDPQRIEKRIIATLSERHSRRVKRVWLLPIGIGLLGTVAAAAGPRFFENLGNSKTETLPTAQDAPSKAPLLRAAPRDRMDHASSAVVESTAPAPAKSADPLRASAPASSTKPSKVATPSRSTTGHAQATLQPVSPESSPAGARTPSDVDRELALYAAARRLQTEQSDAGAALRAWDDYLQRYPQGTLSADARFNRVRCLLDLGERALARRSLQPLAAGVHGNERQTQALTLLQALEETEGEAGN
jgi:hypothetical protein